MIKLLKSTFILVLSIVMLGIVNSCGESKNLETNKEFRYDYNNAKIKTFYERVAYNSGGLGLDNEVNKWLYDNGNDIIVLDIQIVQSNSGTYATVMIVYKNRDIIFI